MTIQDIDITRIKKEDLHSFKLDELVYIYLTAFEIPFYYTSEKLEDITFMRGLFQEFREFIQKTRCNLTFEQFIECCYWWWNLIPLKNDPMIKLKPEIPRFSYFLKPITNIKPRAVIDLKQCYEVITNPKYFKKQTNKFRKISDLQKRKKYKSRNFDYVTFSGIFSKRNEKSIIGHSGLIVLDFDHVTNLKRLREELLNNEYFETELLFISPSGNGLKWIIKIDLEQGTHEENFLAIANCLKLTCEILVDSSGKDISRACFLSFDKDAYINPKYLNNDKKKI